MHACMQVTKYFYHYYLPLPLLLVPSSRCAFAIPTGKNTFWSIPPLTAPLTPTSNPLKKIHIRKLLHLIDIRDSFHDFLIVEEYPCFLAAAAAVVAAFFL